MADTEKASQSQPKQEQQPQPQQHKGAEQKQVIETLVSGTVKWFNVKRGYGFISRNDTKEDLFVHVTAITRNNPRKAVRSVGDGEAVEFDVVVGEKGYEAARVTGPGGEPVKGSLYIADQCRGFHRQYYSRQGGRGGEGAPRRGGMGRRGPPPNQGGAQADEGQEGSAALQQRRNGTKEDVLVHQTAITQNNPRKAVRSVGDDEAVEFDVVVGEKGYEAAGVSGSGGEPVNGSPYAADIRRGFHHQYCPRQGGRGGEGASRRGGMGRRGPPPNQEGAQGDEGQEGSGAPQQCRLCDEEFLRDLVCILFMELMFETNCF